MKIAFFGTWEFSKNILDWILSFEEIDLKLVVSQPDKPVWRKKTITNTPIKEFALKKSIQVSQPDKLKNNEDFFEKLESLDLDFIVVVAYWKIVPKRLLDIPKYWCINIHWSILPNYRWASPIQESLKNWDKKTWLTIMYMSEWMDEWDILDILEIKVDKVDKTPDVFKKFEEIWPKLLVETLKKIMSWEIKWKKQDEQKATYCKKIEKTDWEIDFKQESWLQIYNKFRAYYPWPWIYSHYNDKKFSIEECSFEECEIELDDDFRLWDVVEYNKKIAIICNWWLLILKQVKLEWKKSLDINSFINWNKEFLDYNFC